MRDLIRISQVFRYQDGWKAFPTDAFDVKIEGKYLWIKRLLWSCLKKLGAVTSHWDREMLMTEKVFDPETISVRLLAEVNHQFKLMRTGAPTKILMGNKDFTDLMSDPDIMRMGGFGFPLQSLRPFNMTVQVVPHMSGILLLED